jgi:peptide/nickel transport system substrate-binding protein
LKVILKVLASLIVLIFLTLCTTRAEPTTVSPTLTPTLSPVPPTPTPEPKILTVCLLDEPDSLYLYGTSDIAAQHIWQSIYDGPLDSRGYTYQPVILTALPSLAEGQATIETVIVQSGERVLATDGTAVTLAPGVVVRDIAGKRLTFDGTPIPMARMVVTFTLQADVYWSDGTPLTADDSVFSFELAAALAADQEANANAGRSSAAIAGLVIERTASYRATDARTLVWSGVPGFLDHAYYLNFWHPLPRHAWGNLSTTELFTADVSTQKPIGWGPFIIDKWIPGDYITLVRNPIYFRAPQGLPRLDIVTFRFIPDSATLAEELMSGNCDIVTHEAAEAVRAALPEQPPPDVEPLPIHDTRWELLAFGISPNPNYDRPDFFEDIRVRQAIALCVDRQEIVQQVLGSSGRVLDSILPPEHPLYGGDELTTWGYASSAGQTLLATAGWYDEDGDGVRESHNIPGITDGTPFQVTYHTTSDPLRVQTAQLVQVHLSACGIQVAVETLPIEALFAPGPEGVLFGRRFDLAQFSWHATPDPLCDLFSSIQIPDTGHWYRPNVVGFLDDEYDTACNSALQALPGSEGYGAGHSEAQRIFAERLPILPLYQRLRITLARTTVIGLAPDSTQVSELWNIEQLDIQP